MITRSNAVEVVPGVFRFRVFRPRAAARFLKELEPYYTRAGGQPNSMNKYGRVLSNRKAWWLSEMQEELVESIASDEFGLRLKKHPYAFTVEYDVKKQRSLAAHYDSSAVTLNVCLAGAFQGGSVVFYGDGTPEGNERERYVVHNEVGYALVHRGAHVHRATKLTRGTRTNLIFWCKARKR